ncbi:uncharacterized protein TrAtP1_002575 [Trichoderma atroviride]|uniref:uncharacterized protein n=1 Tax=Hypocrea atroviridis TaxID=63577 RepID=UPI00332E2BD9|nr:hypothetical protein TrAtP1_002575 [Trichoderma atroviride]
MNTHSRSLPKALMSCMSCRDQKLKCDRSQPRCSRCTKRNDKCTYPTTRRRQAEPRRTIPELETRLASLESIVKSSRDDRLRRTSKNDDIIEPFPDESTHDAASRAHSPLDCEAETESSALPSFETSPSRQIPDAGRLEDLTRIYFDKLHYGAPMLRRSSFLSKGLSSNMRPPMYLRYIIAALAASIVENYHSLALTLYHQAKLCIEEEELKDFSPQPVTLAQAQFWCLMANFEAQQMLFSRASTSLSRSLRIAQMLRLHQLDTGDGEPKNRPELEEARRTWWVIFCSDRFVLGSTGWPAMINDDDTSTFLPASEEAFESGVGESTGFLGNVLQARCNKYSSFAGRVLAAHLFYQSAKHVSSHVVDENATDIRNGSFWMRHTMIDNDLATLLMRLPENLQLPRSLQCQNALFTNIIIHTTIICLNRAAIRETRRLALPSLLLNRSQARLLSAAEEIFNILREISEVDAAFSNPLLMYSAYVASSVYLDKSIAERERQAEFNLTYLLHIMIALSKTNPIARSLAIQLAEDMKNVGIDSSAIETVTQSPMAPALVPLFTNDDPSSMILFCSNQNNSRSQDATPILPDSRSDGLTRSAAVADTANMTPQVSRARESATSFAADIEPPILWVDMGFDMGYVA